MYGVYCSQMIINCVGRKNFAEAQNYIKHFNHITLATHALKSLMFILLLLECRSCMLEMYMCTNTWADGINMNCMVCRLSLLVF